MKKPPRVRISADSMADIPAPLAEDLGIHILPATITFGTDTYLEGVNLSREEFYGRLIKYSGLPKTATPGPGAFADDYRSIVAENQQAGVPLEAILSFHPPAGLSGLYNSAFAAGQMIPEANVIVIDTGQISMATGWLAILAARAAIAGESVEQIVALVSEAKPRAHLIAGLETLEWAARSGRVHRLTAAVGTLLAVKPILGVEGGDVKVVERVRTHTRQVERVLEIALAWAPFRELAVVHARAPELAESIADRLAQVHPRQRIVVSEIGCILGSYAGPGAYGITVVQA